MPDLFAHPANYQKADPLSTVANIQPEFYLLSFYDKIYILNFYFKYIYCIKIIFKVL